MLARSRLRPPGDEGGELVSTEEESTVDDLELDLEESFDDIDE